MGFDLNKIGVKKNVPRVNFLEYTGVFEGPEKFGKTAFASLYPNSILLAAEKGYMAQVLNVKDINSWDDFVEFIDLLEENREDIGEDIQTIIIDTVDELYPMAAPYVVRKESIKDGKKYADIKSIPYGQGWNCHDVEFKKQIKRILSLGFTILYLTHSTVKQIKPKDGEPYDVYKSTMPDRCANIIYAAADYIIHGERRQVEVSKGKYEMKRVLTTLSTGDKVAGNRVYFDDDIVFDTEEEAMEKFQVAFRAGIERNLAKAGIDADVDKLAVQQKEERNAEVANYVESVKAEVTAEDLIAQLKESLSKLDNKVKKGLVPQFKELLGNPDYTKSDDIEALTQALALTNEILSE